MYYLKHKNAHASYVDPKTRFNLGRGEVAAVDVLSADMKMRLNARGLLYATVEEYNEFVAKKSGKKVVPAETKVEAPIEPVKVEVSEPVADEAAVEEEPTTDAETKVEDVEPKSKKTFGKKK